MARGSKGCSSGSLDVAGVLILVGRRPQRARSIAHQRRVALPRRCRRSQRCPLRWPGPVAQQKCGREWRAGGDGSPPGCSDAPRNSVPSLAWPTMSDRSHAARSTLSRCCSFKILNARPGEIGCGFFDKFGGRGRNVLGRPRHGGTGAPIQGLILRFDVRRWGVDAFFYNQGRSKIKIKRKKREREIRSLRGSNPQPPP